MNSQDSGLAEMNPCHFVLLCGSAKVRAVHAAPGLDASFLGGEGRSQGYIEVRG